MAGDSYCIQLYDPAFNQAYCKDIRLMIVESQMNVYTNPALNTITMTWLTDIFIWIKLYLRKKSIKHSPTQSEYMTTYYLIRSEDARVN